MSDLGPEWDKDRQRLHDLDAARIAIEESRLDSSGRVNRDCDKPYWEHPLRWLCARLEAEIGDSLDEKLGRPLERHDLEGMAHQICTNQGFRGDPIEGTPDFRWLGPKLAELDNAGVGARLYRQLVEKFPEVMAECGISAAKPTNNINSIQKQRSDFERQWRLDNAPYNPQRDSAKMRAAYAKKFREDATAGAGDFVNARRKFPL